MYSVGIVGLGRIGIQMESDLNRTKPATHVGAFGFHEKVDHLLLCDKDIDKVSISIEILSHLDIQKDVSFTDIDGLINSKPDILVVSTDVSSHCDIVCAAAPHVSLILCEKPIAESVADAQKMVDVCCSNNTILLIDHSRRFLPLTTECKSIIDAGQIGSVKQVSAFYTAGIFNSGSHLIDLLRRLLGDVVKVVSSVPNDSFAPPGDVNVDAIVDFESGRCVLQCLDVKDYAIFDVNIYGTRGFLKLTEFGMRLFRGDVQDCKSFAGYNEMGPIVQIADNSKVSMWRNMANHAIACLEGASPVSTGDDGLAALETIITLIEESRK